MLTGKGKQASKEVEQEAYRLWSCVELSPAREDLHQQFVTFCAANDILEFAANRYEVLADQHDLLVAEKFRRQISLLSSLRFERNRYMTLRLYQRHLRLIESVLCFLVGVSMAFGLFGGDLRHFWMGLALLCAYGVIRVIIAPPITE